MLGCRASRRGGDAHRSVRLRSALGRACLALREARRADRDVRRSERRAAEARPCRSTCGSFAPCSRRPHPRTASCRRSNRATPSWRERCSCSRCTRAPRTIALPPRPIGRRVCSTSPTGTFSAPSSWSPATPSSYDGMARLWRDWGMPDLALSDVHRALNCSKKSAEIYNTLGTMLESLGQQAGGRARLSKRGGAQPARHVRVEQPVLPPDERRATAPPLQQFCEAALAIDPNFAPARNNLALVEAKRGDLAARGEAPARRIGERRLALQRRRPASHREALRRGGARVRPGGGGTTLVDHRAPAIRAGAPGRASGGAGMMFTAEQEASLQIPAPKSLAQAGLSRDLMTQLVLKTLHFAGELTGTELARASRTAVPRHRAGRRRQQAAVSPRHFWWRVGRTLVHVSHH